MSIAYLISWSGAAKVTDFQVETFKSRTDAVSAGAILEHKSLERSAKAVGTIADLEGVGMQFLVALYNAITGESQKGFHDSSTGRKKVWETLTTKYPDPNPVQSGQAEENHEGEKTSGDAGDSTEQGEATMATKKAAKAKKTTTKKPAGEKKPKGPGVIDTIVDVLQNKGGTVEQITEKVAKKFPDKAVDGIKATVKIQVNRLSKPKAEGGRGLKVKREKIEGTNELHYFI